MKRRAASGAPHWCICLRNRRREFEFARQQADQCHIRRAVDFRDLGASSSRSPLACASSRIAVPVRIGFSRCSTGCGCRGVEHAREMNAAVALADRENRCPCGSRALRSALALAMSAWVACAHGDAGTHAAQIGELSGSSCPLRRVRRPALRQDHQSAGAPPAAFLSSRECAERAIEFVSG